MSYKLALSIWNYEAYTEPKTLEEVIAETAAAGLGLEFWPDWKDQKDLYQPENRSRLIELAKNIPSSLHGGKVNTLEEHINQIEAARDTSSRVIVVHNDHLRLGTNEFDPSLVKEIAQIAKSCGVSIALENADRDGAFETLCEGLSAAPELSVCLDIGHLHCAGDRPFRDYISTFGDRIVHLHLQDVYMTPGTLKAISDSHRPPGDCQIPRDEWLCLLEWMETSNFDGFAVLEIRPFTPIEIAQRTSAFLQSLAKPTEL